jgi:hypothetical protein
MRALPGVAAFFCAMAIASVACAQTPSPSLSFDALKTSVPQSVDTGSIRELTVQPSTASSAAAPSGAAAGNAVRRTLELTAQRRIMGRLRRERNPQLSDQSLVLIVRDADGRNLSWHIAPNPWIVRAETPDPTGRLTGRILDQREQAASFTVPDIQGARRVTLYQPRWSDGQYVLDAIGDVMLP